MWHAVSFETVVKSFKVMDSLEDNQLWESADQVSLSNDEGSGYDEDN